MSVSSVADGRCCRASPESWLPRTARFAGRLGMRLSGSNRLASSTPATDINGAEQQRIRPLHAAQSSGYIRAGQRLSSRSWGSSARPPPTEPPGRARRVEVWSGIGGQPQLLTANRPSEYRSPRPGVGGVRDDASCKQVVSGLAPAGEGNSLRRRYAAAEMSPCSGGRCGSGNFIRRVARLGWQ